MWCLDIVLTIFFSLSFLFFLVFMAIRSFFLFWLLAFFVNPKRFFFWGKTRDSENTVLNIFFSGSEWRWSDWSSVGVRRSKAKRGQDECCYSFFLFFFFLFFCWGRDIFAKIKHTKLTYYSTFISRIQHKISIFSSSFFFVKLMWWTGLHLFFSSLGFFLLAFFGTFNRWQWLEGHSFWASVGNFCFWIIRIYSDLFGLLGRLGLGNHGKNFAGNLIKLGFHFVQDGVDLGLV